MKARVKKKRRQRSTAPAKKARTSGPKRRVLLVDDEPDLVLAISTRMKASGYDVLTAADGEEALRKAEEGPDIIVLDVILPDRSGLDICATLRKDPRYDQVPIILFTGKDEQEIVTRFGTNQYSLRMWGADAFVKKGDGTRALFHAIDELLSKPRTAPEA